MIRRQLPLILAVAWIAVLFGVSSLLPAMAHHRPGHGGPKPKPTPTPTLQPTLAPTPSPTPRPTPTVTPTASGCTATLPTASGDQTAALQALANAAPAGARICFAGTHTINGRVLIQGRTTALTFQGPGTLTTAADRANLSLFAIYESSGVAIRDLVLDGGRPSCTYSSAHEFEFAVDFRQGSGTVERVTMRNWGGDFVYIGYRYANVGSWSHDVIVRDSSGDCNGRMGIAVTAGRDVLVENYTQDRVALFAFDCEPDYAFHGCVRWTIRNTTTARYGFDGVSPSCGSVPCTPYWFKMTSASAGSGQTTDLVITGNSVTNGHLRTQIEPGSGRIARVTFTGNTASQSDTLRFAHIDGLTLSGNTGTYSIADCTGVVQV